MAGVSRTRSPVALARAVMERSPHVFLAGAGAEAFAREMGAAEADAGWFATPERQRQLAELLSRDADAFDVDMKYGTVGAVARDAAGHLAAATSTGGVTGKRPGRIGDTPVIGAGTFADDRAGAVSCTGAGEFFLRTGAAQAIATRMRLLGEGAGRGGGGGAGGDRRVGRHRRRDRGRARRHGRDRGGVALHHRRHEPGARDRRGRAAGGGVRGRLVISRSSATR